MRLRLYFFLLLIFPCTITLVQAQYQNQNFDKAAYYKVLESGNLATIELQINIVKDVAANEKEAFEGALLMKKSGMLSKPKDKLSTFKSGRAKLESAISKENENTEYRFLRLIIQEHAPKIVKYKSDLADDSKYVRSNYRSLPAAVQQVIFDYSQKSTFLKLP